MFNNSPALELRAGESRAVVLLHGAQVVSWTIAGREQLYVSPTAAFRDGEPIRGGIPVCFPQFDMLGPLPKHGFARVMTWVAVPAGDDAAAAATLVLEDNDAGRAAWGHAFRASLAVCLGEDDLDVALTVASTDSSPLDFTGALHTYLRINDPVRANLQGLGEIDYRDNLTGQQGRDDAASTVAIGAVGRTYRDPQAPLALRDGARRVMIRNRGFDNVVVWNPGTEMSFPDLPPDGWREFLCVEAAQVNRPVTLGPGQLWSGGQHLRVSEDART